MASVNRIFQFRINRIFQFRINWLCVANFTKKKKKKEVCCVQSATPVGVNCTYVHSNVCMYVCTVVLSVLQLKLKPVTDIVSVPVYSHEGTCMHT